MTQIGLGPKITKFWFFSIGVGIISVSSFLVGIEYVYRLTEYLVKGPSINRREVVDHAELEWSLNPERERLTKQNYCGEAVVREPPLSAFLNKMPTYDSEVRILFVGDSFTQASTVSTGAAYYDVFEALNKDRYSVFSAGVGGYGNLQEYLLLEKVFAETNPNIVVFQLTNNDLLNNVHEIERASTRHSNNRSRPYLDPVSRRIYFENPSYLPFPNSRGVNFGFGRTLRLGRNL